MKCFNNIELNERIEELIMKNLTYRRKIDSITFEEYYEKSITFAEHIKRKFNEEDYDYVFKYLANQDVLVRGKDRYIFLDYDNYKCANKKKSFFLKKIDKVATKEENQEMIKEYIKETNPEQKKKIRNAIAEKNLRFVYFIANRFSLYTKFSEEELLGSGYEGLIYAIENYKIGEFLFSSYMSRVVHTYMLKSLYEMYDFQNPKVYGEVSKYKKQFENENRTRGLSFQDISDEILDSYLKDNPKKKQFSTIAKITHNIPDYFSNHTSEETAILYYDKSLDSVEEKVFKDELHVSINDALEKFTDEEKEIIYDYYGFYGKQQKTLDEIGKERGFTRTTIGNKRDAVIKKMRKDKCLKSYYYN